MYHVPSLPVVRKKIGAREKIGMSDGGCPTLPHTDEIVAIPVYAHLYSLSIPNSIRFRQSQRFVELVTSISKFPGK